MKNGVLTLAIKLLSLLITPIIVTAVALNAFPQFFVAGNYHIFHYDRELTYSEHDDVRVLIIGDSAAESSYMPLLLSEDTYNYAVGSETPLDGYYRLKEYLENNTAPEYIFCSYNPVEFTRQSYFWGYPVLGQGIRLEDSLEIVRNLDRFKDTEDLQMDMPEWNVLMYHFGIHPECMEGCIKGMLRLGYYDENQEMYRKLQQDKGYWQYKRETENSNTLNTFASDGDKEFKVTDIADYYFRKTIELCAEYDVQLIVETIPMSQSSYQAIQRTFVEDYLLYWEGLQKRYPAVNVNLNWDYYEDRYFGDSIHLNMDGAKKFSEYIREKYPDAFGRAEDEGV